MIIYYDTRNISPFLFRIQQLTHEVVFLSRQKRREDKDNATPVHLQSESTTECKRQQEVILTFVAEVMGGISHVEFSTDS